MSLDDPKVGGTATVAAAARPRRALLTRRQKAAVIVRLLLAQKLEPDLSRLTEAQQTALARDIATLRRVDKDTLSAVLGEFVAEIEGIALSFPADLSGALAQLEGYISDPAAAKLRRESGLSYAGDPWDRLSALDIRKLAPILLAEPPEIAAVILSKLKVPRAAEVLGLLPGPRARDITFAISRTANIDPETVQAIGGALLESLDAEPMPAFPEGAVARVGAILNTSTAQIRDDVLDGLDAQDADFGRKVRQAIFTFANIPQRIAPRDVPRILRDIDEAVLVQALAAAQTACPAAAAHLLDSVSTRMADQLRDAISDLGTVSGPDGEKAMAQIVLRIRDMERLGELILSADGDTDEDPKAPAVGA